MSQRFLLNPRWDSKFLHGLCGFLYLSWLNIAVLAQSLEKTDINLIVVIICVERIGTAGHIALAWAGHMASAADNPYCIQAGLSIDLPSYVLNGSP